jgi:N-acetylmuramoyl-L-alanine amidase
VKLAKFELPIFRTLLLFCMLFLSASAAEEKRISIYSNAANYLLPVMERERREYVGLLEVLDPLGTVSVQGDGARWKIRYNNVVTEFVAGNSRARIQGRDFDLHAAFLLENGRGLVPLASLGSLLPRILGGPVTFHEASRRLFIGSVAIGFTAQISKADPSSLVMNFTAPVNPMISTEPGKLRMVFTRDPVVAPGPQPLAFDSKTMSSADFQESNGIAELTINASAPLFASFSNGGRTITVRRAPQAAVQTPPEAPKPPASAPPATAASPVLPATTPPSTAPSQVVRYFAVVDASHGGQERGAALTNDLAEKEVTLAFARRLREELENRGLATMLLRDGDSTISLEQRAGLTNRARPAIYICLHASSVGNGARIYTALLPAGGEGVGPFLDWQTAQSAFLPLSRTVASGISHELRKRGIPGRVLMAALRPLNNITTPAIAIEVAPPRGGKSDLRSSTYRDLVTSAVGGAIVAMRGQLEAGR